jgi:short-subunit dehydrogenase
MNRTVLITGTTSGLGSEFSNIFAREGFNLVLVSKNKQKLKLQKEEISKKYGIKVHIITKDLSVPSAPEEIYSDTHKLNINIDILVNNAGFNESGPFYKTNVEKELQMLQVHIVALTNLTKLFLPEMIKNKYGKILNIGSTGSFVTGPMDAVYCATKAYVLSFTSAIDAELSSTGVRASTLCPGAMKTEFAKKAGMENTVAFRRFVMQPKKVAEIAYRKFMKNRKIIIPGLFNKILVASIPFTPNKISEKMSIFFLKKR